MGFGSDFSCFEDFDLNLSFLSGTRNEQTAMAQAIARRLITPRGGLFYDPSYGLDLREFISETYRPGDVETMISAECRKDERIAECKARITVAADAWTILINCTTLSGNVFDMTLSVSQVTVQLLNVGTVT